MAPIKKKATPVPPESPPIPQTISTRPEPAHIPGIAHFEPLLTSSEAATLLRIHPKTLERMARHHRSGEKKGIPGYFYAGRWFFRRSDLDGWLRTAVQSA
jgi:excisionase family DNA binding protein